MRLLPFAVKHRADLRCTFIISQHFLVKRGIYLEDLFVSPDFRGRGAGDKLLRELAHIAVREGCGRLEWSCLDWNTPSVEFYKSRGARPMDDWTVYRVTGDRLTALAKSDGGGK